MTADFSSQQATASLPQQEMEELSAQILQRAAEHLQSGEVALAKKLYSSLLDILPDHPAAHYYFGMLEMQGRQPDDGLRHLEAALAAAPEQEQYWLAYIDALIQTGQEDTARHFLKLGQQHGLEGNATEDLAERLTIPPLVMSQQQEKQQRVADVNSTQVTVQKNPEKRAKVDTKRSAKAPSAKKINAIVALYGQGKIAEVEKLARSLTIHFPEHGFGWKSLAGVLMASGQREKALQATQNSVKFSPHDAEAYSNLGNIFLDMDRYAEAEVSLRRSLALKPNYADAHYNLSIALDKQDRLIETEASIRKALLFNPNHVAAHYNLSIILKKHGRLTEMEACLRQVISLNPNYVKAHTNLGLALLNQCKHKEAEASLRTALNLNPDSGEQYSNLLFCLSQMEGIDVNTLFTEHCNFGLQIENPLKALRQHHRNLPDPERCLQIGFVSADLRNHAMASFIEPILQYLAGYENLSLHAYYNHATEDAVTHRLQGYFSHWHSVFKMSDTVMEQQIRSDGIDILIDLSGHTAENRLPVFARKPAPVQASWIGYPGTTGLQAVDYYLSDYCRLPVGKYDDQFTEKIVRMPISAPFLPYENAPPVNALPAIENSYITFGSFNRLDKLNHAVIILWSQLLRALPDSKIIIAGINIGENYDFLIKWFTQEGILEDRLTFHYRTNLESYLTLHHQVDMCLNPFPYTGATTLCNALWMGVPTLTLTGKTIPSHGGASYLTHVGLENFVAQDAPDFVKKGLLLTADLTELNNLRGGLRERFMRSAVGQPALAAAGLDRALRMMWRRWCEGLEAAPLQVDMK